MRLINNLKTLTQRRRAKLLAKQTTTNKTKKPVSESKRVMNSEKENKRN